MSRRSQKKENTRESILAAARTVLASDGPEALSLSKVANLAGINRGTAYQHFETREELIKATVAWVSEHLSVTVFGSTDLESVATPKNIDQRPIFDVASRLIEFAVENPALCRIWLFEVLASDNPADDLFLRQFKLATQELSESDSSQEGVDAEPLSVMVLAGYFLWPLLGNASAKTPEQRQQMARRMQREVLRLFMHGVLRAEAFPHFQTLLDDLPLERAESGPETVGARPAGD